MVQFGKFLKTLSLRFENSNETFRVIFKQCVADLIYNSILYLLTEGFVYLQEEEDHDVDFLIERIGQLLYLLSFPRKIP